MAANVKRGRGSNQYADKIEAVPAEERRLPRKRRWGMSNSGKMMATPGKPFQCPSCAELHPTGHMCGTCQPEVMVSLSCAGCGQAMLPSGANLCEACEELALVPVGEPAGGPAGVPAAPPMGAPIGGARFPAPPPQTPPVGRPVPSMPPPAPSPGPPPFRPPPGPTGPYPGTPPASGGLPPRRLPPRR
jgi:hypothetical protein